MNKKAFCEKRKKLSYLVLTILVLLFLCFVVVNGKVDASTQYKVTFTQTGLSPESVTNGTVVVTVNGSEITFGNLPFDIPVDMGSNITYSYEAVVSSNISGRQHRLCNVTGLESPITVTANTTVIGNYATQYLVNFTQTGLDSTATGTVITINGDTKTFLDLSNATWVDDGGSILYSYSNAVSSSISGKSFSLVNVTGPDPPISITGSVTVTGNYVTQYEVTFAFTGLDATTTGTVATINGSAKTYTDLPLTMWVNSGTLIPYSYSDVVSSTETGERFSLVDVSGPTSPITVTSPVTVTGNYKTQYELTFNQSGVHTGFAGIVVTIDGPGYGVDDLPTSFWWDEDSVHSFSFQSPLIVSSNAKRYVWNSTSGLSSTQSDSIEVSTSGSIIGNYKTQYYLTVTSIYDSPTPTSGWFDAGASINASVTSPWPGLAGTQYVCTGWTGTGSVPPSGTETSVTFAMSQPSNITWTWKTQYYLTVSSPNGTTGGEDWYDSGDTAYAMVTPLTVPGPAGTQYVFTHWSGDASGTSSPSDPITMDGPKTAVANWKTLYYLTVISPYGTPSGAGWYNESTNAYAGLDTGVVPGPTGTQYVFVQWTGGASGTDYTQSNVIHMDAPKTAVAEWKTQYQITFNQTGVGSDFNETIVIIDTGLYNRTTLPISFWWDLNSAHTFVFQSPLVVTPDAKQHAWNSTSGLSSLQSGSIDISMSGNVIGSYNTQYSVTFTQTGLDSTATGTVLTVDGEGKSFGDLPYSDWFDSGATINYSYANIVETVWWVSGKRFFLIDVSPSSPITVIEDVTVTGSYLTQYLLTVGTNGLGTAVTNVYVYNGVTIIGNATDDTPFSDWVAENSLLRLNIDDEIPVGSTRFKFTGWSGDATGTSLPVSVTMDSDKDITANYKTQYFVTFDQTGLNATPSSVVLTIDGVNWIVDDLPFSFWWDQNSAHNFAFISPIVFDSVEHYGWISTSGLSTLQSGTLTVTTSGSLVGNYGRQFQITFGQSGVGLDFSAAVAVIDGIATDLPVSFWWNVGSVHSFAFPSPLVVTLNAKRYVWVSTSGLSSLQSGSITVSTSGNIIGNYKNQYYLTFTQTGISSDATGTVVTVDGGMKTLGDLPFSMWVDGSDIVTYSYKAMVSSSFSGKRFNLDDVIGPTSPITVVTATTITGNYITQYQVTFAFTGLDATASGTIATLNGSAKTYTDLPTTMWVNSGTSVSYSYNDTVLSTETGKRFSVVNVTGLTSPITVIGSVTVTGNYETQYEVSVSQLGVATDFTGTVVTIDGTEYGVTDLPKSFWWDKNSTRYFAFASPLLVNASKQYIWISTSGLSTNQSDTLTITGSGRVTGHYSTGVRYQVTFTHAGLDATANSTVLIVDGLPKTFDDLPLTMWVDSDSVVIYSYSDTVTSIVSGKRFKLGVITGPTSPITLTGPTTVTGNYTTQYYFTLVSPYDTPGGMGWYNESATAYATLNTSIVDHGNGTRRLFTNWSGQASGTNLTSNPVTMDAAKTAIANWKTQHYLSLVSSPSGATTPSGEGWYDAGTYASISTDEFVSFNGSTYRFTKWTSSGDGWMDVTDPLSLLTTVLVDKPKTVMANYVLAYLHLVTFTQTGLSSDATGIVVTVDDEPQALADLPTVIGVYTGSTLTYSYKVTLSSSISGKRFRLDNVTGPTSPINVTADTTITGNYVTQHLVTFDQTGLDSSATGTIVTIEGDEKIFGNLPFTMWVDKMSSTTYFYSDSISSTEAGKRFKLVDVAGPVSPITITSSVTVKGNYKIQYRTSFVFKLNDASEILYKDPTQIRISGAPPNNTLLVFASYSDVWLDNVEWEANEILWQGNNVVPDPNPEFSPTPDGAWIITCRVYKITSMTFDDHSGKELYAQPTYGSFIAPNNTEVSLHSFTGCTLYLQNGTYTFKTITWQSNNVVDSPLQTFDPTNGNPSIKCRVYSLKITCQDDSGNPLAKASLKILQPNGTSLLTNSGSDGVYFAPQVQNGTYTITVHWQDVDVHTSMVLVDSNVDETISCRVYTFYAWILLGVVSVITSVAVLSRVERIRNATVIALSKVKKRIKKAQNNEED